MELEQKMTGGRRGEAMQRSGVETCLQGWKRALEQKDATELARHYESGAVVFALAPPLQSKGFDAQAEQAWFDTWREGPRYEEREVEVVTLEDVAVAHSLAHMTGTKTSGERVDLWFRSTLALRRVGSDWKIFHEHTSVPFKMDGSMKADVDLRPE